MKIKTIITILFFAISTNLFSQTSKEEINGKWYFEMLHNDIGNCNFFMDFALTSDSTFQAFTRKNVDREILGSFKATMARTFAKMFKKGSLARIAKGKYKIKNDTIFLSGIFVNPMANSYFEGTISKTVFKANLLNGNKKKIATIVGNNGIKQAPLHNYKDIIDKAFLISNEKIYNQNITQTKEWRKFRSSTSKFSNKVQDDLEMVFGFFYFKRKIPISHFALLKIPESESNEKETKKYCELKELNKESVLLTIKSFNGSKKEVDSVFDEINEKKYANLIIDLRGNSGGSIEAGLPIIQNLISEPLYGGIFLTQKWFNKTQNIPKTNDYKNFEKFSEANFDAIISGIHNKEGLCILAKPSNNPFKGKVFVLTDNVTASTCEPIVYGLKQYNRAIVVGEKTAGAMLNGEQFSLLDGYKILIPTADFYTADGQRLDKVGVEPNIKVKPNEALEYVLKNLIN